MNCQFANECWQFERAFLVIMSRLGLVKQTALGSGAHMMVGLLLHPLRQASRCAFSLSLTLLPGSCSPWWISWRVPCTAWTS